ncbi:hypothetical protein ABZ946_34860 [Streptomyces sp. NPDC046324]|uniref:hypothetical protein n=1 Tax=Streptomyces sp. NPDC046324 TaxID=3154915 RepID=UPI0033C2D80B
MADFDFQSRLRAALLDLPEVEAPEHITDAGDLVVQFADSPDGTGGGTLVIPHALLDS